MLLFPAILFSRLIPLILVFSHLLAFFAEVRKGLAIVGIDQWGPEYPAEEHVTSDLKNDSVYVYSQAASEEMKNLKPYQSSLLQGTITLDQNQSPQYQNVQWKFETSRVGVIHRLAVHPDHWGKGIAKQLCLFAEDWGKQQGWEVIRLDTYSKNPASQRLYEKLGYTKAEGACYFHGNPNPFWLYEKRIP